MEPTKNEITQSKNTAIKRGRPKGAKNKDTLFKELMAGRFRDQSEREIEKVFSVLFEKAQEGDMKAIKLIMDRVIPTSKAEDLGKAQASGITVSINVGKLERPQDVEVIEDADYEEVK